MPTAKRNDIVTIGAGVLSSLAAPCPVPPHPRKRIYERKEHLVRYSREIILFLQLHRDWRLQRTRNLKYIPGKNGRYFWNLRPANGMLPWIPCQGRSAEYARRKLQPCGWGNSYRWADTPLHEASRQHRLAGAPSHREQKLRGHFLMLSLPRRPDAVEGGGSRPGQETQKRNDRTPGVQAGGLVPVPSG